MHKLKFAAAIAAVFCLSVVLLLCVPPPASRAQQQENKSSADAILRQLFAALQPVPQGICENDGALQAAYAEKNRLYFAGKLPAKITTCWDPTLQTVNLLGYTDRRTPDGSFRIRLSPALQPVGIVAEIILLHEMVHVRLFERTAMDSHGKEFRNEMRRLAREGAFDELW